MLKDHILALDQSTSGSKAMIIDSAGEIISAAQIAHKQIYPRPGWVEHDPIEIYDNVVYVLKEAVKKAGLTFDEIKIISVTNQRETVL